MARPPARPPGRFPTQRVAPVQPHRPAQAAPQPPQTHPQQHTGAVQGRAPQAPPAQHPAPTPQFVPMQPAPTRPVPQPPKLAPVETKETISTPKYWKVAVKGIFNHAGEHFEPNTVYHVPDDVYKSKLADGRTAFKDMCVTSEEKDSY